MPTATLLANSGAIKYNSVFANGTAPSPSSGIAISGTVAHGGIVSIVADGTLHFGDQGPDLVCFLRMENMTAGTDLDITDAAMSKQGFISRANPLAYQTLVKFPVRTASALPYTKGIAVGQLNGTIGNSPKLRTIVSRTSEKIFRHAYYWWPAANQVAQLAQNDPSQQVKCHGSQYIDGFSTGGGVRVDAYTGLYGTTNDGSGNAVMEQNSAVVASNQNGFVSTSLWNFPTSNGKGVWVDSTHQKSTVQVMQNYLVSRPPTNTAHCRVIDTAVGQTCNYTEDRTHPSVCTEYKFDRTDFPQNVQGYRIDLDCHFYVAGWYEAYGEGAACRVELADTSTPITGTKYVSVNLCVYWSDKLIQIEVVEGLFAGVSLSGKYFHVYNKDNQFVAGVLIP